MTVYFENMTINRPVALIIIIWNLERVFQNIIYIFAVQGLVQMNSLDEI